MVWSGSRPACLPLPFICLPVLFICLPGWGDCGRVPGWLVSHFLSFVSHFFSFVSHFFSIVSQFFSFVSQAGCLWSGSRLACLPLPFICLPLLFICLPLFPLSPRLGASPFSAGHVAFLFICLPGPSLLVPCSISIHVSPRPVTGDVRPFPLGM